MARKSKPDLATVSAKEYLSELGRKRSAARDTFSGGRAPSCTCGVCSKCVKREAMRNYRASLKKKKK